MGVGGSFGGVGWVYGTLSCDESEEWLEGGVSGVGMGCRLGGWVSGSLSDRCNDWIEGSCGSVVAECEKDEDDWL